MNTSNEYVLKNKEAQELADTVYKYFLIGSVAFVVACSVVLYLTAV